MKKEKKDARRERTILVMSSAFVLAALTMTGIYMRRSNAIKEGEDYLAQLESVEENTLDKLDQAAESRLGSMTDQNSLHAFYDYEMDYMPLEEDEIISEAGSGQVELGRDKIVSQNSLNTNKEANQEENKTVKADEILTGAQVGGISDGQMEEIGEWVNEQIDEQINEQMNEQINEGIFNEEGLDNEEVFLQQENELEEIPAAEVQERVLNFDEELVRPVSGAVIIPFNMDGYEYFQTLDYYSHNSAEIISAAQGENVAACADGIVEKIYQDAKLGQVLVLKLGGGYEATYGQLCNIAVSEGDYVSAGQTIAQIQAPTRFYNVEGSNLYFKLTADNQPVNPEAFY